MELSRIKVLLVEDSSFDARIIKDMLSGENRDFIKTNFDIRWVDCLNKAHSELNGDYFDIILLDLTLPDSMGLNTLQSVYGEFPEIPIIVLTSLNDQLTALKAVKEGAQDYLVKGQFNVNVLLRSIHYSIERHKMLVALRGMALIDQLTGLYNRHGFLNLAEHHMKLAKRKGRKLLIIYCDVDYLKYVNDTYGHIEGDILLKQVSQILKETFRESDVICRFGGDEFVILTVDASYDNKDKIIERLKENIRLYNENSQREYEISLSIGAVVYDPKSSCTTIGRILDEADKLMYIDKKGKKYGKYSIVNK